MKLTTGFVTTYKYIQTNLSSCLGIHIFVNTNNLKLKKSF